MRRHRPSDSATEVGDAYVWFGTGYRTGSPPSRGPRRLLMHGDDQSGFPECARHIAAGISSHVRRRGFFGDVGEPIERVQQRFERLGLLHAEASSASRNAARRLIRSDRSQLWRARITDVSPSVGVVRCSLAAGLAPEVRRTPVESLRRALRA